MMQFDQYQRDAVNRLKSGSILVGGTGSGKSRTSLVYFFSKECGGKIIDRVEDMKDPKPLYIITTAAKRDKKEWDDELKDFPITDVTIDSWNNIKKYVDIKDSFFIFDEQRVVGSGLWSKSFIKITKNNNWLLLSATPGDQWCDYIPVFIANGFYKNRTEFCKRHVVWSRYTDFPKIEKYIDTTHLEKLRESIQIKMNNQKTTIAHRINVVMDYDKDLYSIIKDKRWDFINDKPIENASQYTQLERKVVNGDQSRIDKLMELIIFHRKVIVFYNFDYERESMIQLFKEMEVDYGELNGHSHDPIPESNYWVYIVQYNAGAEGWNCTSTDTIIFYSLSYSYRMTHQAAGRIDRRNTPYKDLYYYYFYSKSPIDRNILKCLEEKKNFNETKYYKKMIS